jgi:multidrug efflux pump subunit AcrA (membrane-fusion protein)
VDDARRYVRDGMQVSEGQDLAQQLDPTRFEAQQNEGQAKRLALRGTIARLTAYDYTSYGSLHGTVSYISPDALGDTEQQRGTGPDNTDYRVIIRTERTATLREKGKPLPVLPGMTATVDMRTGERSVLNFLLRPMLKSKEAFRER